MKKPVRIILLGDAKKEYEKLNELAGMHLKEGKENSEEIQLLKSIKQKIELIKDNPFYGDNIEKNKIPKNYEVNNLWRVELTGFWRMLYTIKGDQIEIICFVLNIVDHNNYNKIFSYKKK